MKIYKHSVVLAAALFAAGLSDATAAAQLRLSDGTPGGEIVIVDQGPGDSNPEVGAIVYTGGVGVNWIVGTAVGVSKPVIGGPTAPYMDLNTKFLSQGAGPLTVEFTDTGFIGGGTVTANIGGNTSGNVTYRAYADAANAPFGKSSLLTSQGPLTGLGFSGTATGTTLNPSAPYSLTLETIIQHGGPGITGFDADLFITPLPVAAIGDRVWLDTDSDGIQDPGEPGVPGVVVQLLECVENLVLATTTTDLNGLYLFGNLTPGSYKIRVIAPAGFGYTLRDAGLDAVDSDADGTGLMVCTTLDPGETDRTWDAGLVVLACTTCSCSGSFGLCDLGQARNYTVLALGGSPIKISSSNTKITGNVAIGPNASGSVLLKATITGALYVDPTTTVNYHDDIQIQGGVVSKNLVQANLDARAASACAAALPVTQTFGNITTSKTFVGNGGLNVISVSSIGLVKQTITFQGSASDVFVINVAGGFSFSSSQMILSGGVRAENILWNFPGPGSTINIFKAITLAQGTFLAPQRSYIQDLSQLNGKVIVGGEIRIHSGAFVNCP